MLHNRSGGLIAGSKIAGLDPATAPVLTSAGNHSCPTNLMKRHLMRHRNLMTTAMFNDVSTDQVRISIFFLPNFFICMRTESDSNSKRTKLLCLYQLPG